MIEEQGLVIALEKNVVVVVVQTQSGTSCGSCSSKKGCGISAMAKGMSREYTTEFRLVLDLNVRVGDKVILALDESALLKGAVLIYLFPLIAMIMGALLGETCSNLFAISSEWLTVSFGVAGLIGSQLVIRYHSIVRRFQRRIQPKITEILQ